MPEMECVHGLGCGVVGRRGNTMRSDDGPAGVTANVNADVDVVQVGRGPEVMKRWDT